MLEFVSKALGIVGGAVITVLILIGIAAASGCTAEAETLAQSIDASGGDDEGEELPAATTVARRIEFPAITITGCVPVDEPGRITFCDGEVDPVVALLAAR